jgi:dihydrofolate reductase
MIPHVRNKRYLIGKSEAGGKKVGKIIYAALTSLDGFIADDNGNFDWAQPGEDLHTFINTLELKNGTMILGRAMYEVLSVWEDLPDIDSQPEYIKEYQSAWKRTRKIVISTSLREASTSNTGIIRHLNRAGIEEIKKNEPENIGIGGASVASQVLAMGLIDEIYRFIFPIMVGSGKPWLTSVKPVRLEKIESGEFDDGVVMIRYEVGQTGLYT